MYGHSWACKLIDIGELFIREGGSDEDFRVAAVAGGFIDVKDSIIIYTDAVEWAEDIDMDRVLSEKAKAEDWLVHHEKDADPRDVIKRRLPYPRQLQEATLQKAVSGGDISEALHRQIPVKEEK